MLFNEKKIKAGMKSETQKQLKYWNNAYASTSLLIKHTTVLMKQNPLIRTTTSSLFLEKYQCLVE